MLQKTITAYRETAAFNPCSGAGYQLPEYPFVVPPDLEAAGRARYPVVIVGGGISGLTCACVLAQLGVDAILLDEDNTVGVRGASSRGICYAQKSLEIYKRLGIYERIRDKGIQWSVGRTFAGHDEVYSFDLRQQQTHNLSVEPPFINIQQFYIEGFLVDRIVELGHVDLRWSNRVVGFEQNEQFATLSVETPAGTYTLEAEHVVDATGVHSPFRKWLQVRIDRKAGDDRWCIADVRFKEHPPLERHTWVQAPFNEDRAVWQHLMADDVWRLDYQMAPNCDMEYVSREDVVRDRLARQFGKEVDCDVVWVGPYAYRSECLDMFRHGRVFFIGDAAHVVSPFGARGGNSGLQDADNLAWKLAAVLQGRAGPALLDSYDAERREAAQQNVQVTNRTARFLRAPEGIERVFRDAALGLAKHYPFARQFVNTGRMSAPNTYSHTAVCGEGGGGSVQNVAFTWPNGSAGELVDLLRWANGRLLVLVFGAVSAAGAKRLRALAATDTVRAVSVVRRAADASALETIVDAAGHVARAVGLSAPSADQPPRGLALLRPDGYLAARSNQFGNHFSKPLGSHLDSRLVQAVSKALGA